jgi:hypothetical protein
MLLEVEMMADKSTIDEHEKLKKREEAEKPKAHQDELDRSLADSFPASDPPAPVVKGTTSNPKPHEKN